VLQLNKGIKINHQYNTVRPLFH